MKKVTAKKETEDWMQRKWRPMMAVMYMVVCIFDFIIFPIGFTIVQFWETQAANDAFRQWQPLTLVGAGLFHMAMGAVLGITAWSRGQEKIAGVASTSGGASNGFNLPTNGTTTPGLSTTGGYNSSSSYNYAATQPTANYTTNSYTQSDYSRDNNNVATVAGYKGKKAPMQPEEPIL